MVQVPAYRIALVAGSADHARDLGSGRSGRQLLLNLASFGREAVPMVTSQLNIRPVFDVHADVQGRDLYGAAARHRRGLEGATARSLEGD